MSSTSTIKDSSFGLGLALAASFAILTGCGSAVEDSDNPNEFRQHCNTIGGTYVEFENRGDACVHGGNVVN